MYFICRYDFNCIVFFCVRDNSLWWANVHCKSNLPVNKLSYSYSYSYVGGKLFDTQHYYQTLDGTYRHAQSK